MLVIIANRSDATARALAARWKGHCAELLTCDDLSVAGWRHHLGTGEVSTAVVSGRVVATGEIAGVLTRLPSVDRDELTRIEQADRAYVAEEMTAFLQFWLSELTCRVLNRPTPTCLSGPNWRPERWVDTAARIGIPVCPVRRHVMVTAGLSAAPPEGYPVTVTVVGDRCFGQADQMLTMQAHLLAAAAGVDLLAVNFSGRESSARFVSADLWPDISAPEISDAILEYLSRDRRC